MANKKVAPEIIEHLRSFGPNARVLLIGADAEQVQEVMLDGPSGLRTLYGAEFTATRPKYQLTHRGGGLVYVHTADRGPEGLSGRLYSMVVSEVLWKQGGGETNNVVNAARLQLRIGPEPRWVSTQGMEYPGE